MIFISYRREDSSGYARAVYNEVCKHFDEKHVFMDVDTIEPGEDFVEVIEKAVGSCDVLIILIGKQWLSAADSHGRKLDNPNDFVRLEIATALGRKIRVIPVLLGDVEMPSVDELPDVLKPVVRRNALEISHTRFNADVGKLIETLEKVLYPQRRATESGKKQEQRFTQQAKTTTDEVEVQAKSKSVGKNLLKWLMTISSVQLFCLIVFMSILLMEAGGSDFMAWFFVIFLIADGLVVAILGMRSKVWLGIIYGLSPGVLFMLLLPIAMQGQEIYGLLLIFNILFIILGVITLVYTWRAFKKNKVRNSYG